MIYLSDDCGCIPPPRADERLQDPVPVLVLRLLLKRDVLVDAAADRAAEEDLRRVPMI